MNETPCRTFREGNYKRAEIEVSPKINSETRISQNISRLNSGANRSSTSSNACRFKIANLNSSNRFAMSTPRKADLKHKKNEGIFKFIDKQHLLNKMPEALLQQLENEKMKVDLLQHEINYRAQREKQILKEIEDLNKAVKLREDILASERAKEKEIARKNLAQNELLIDQHKEKIKELTKNLQDANTKDNLIVNLTSQNKAYESKIKMLEMTLKEQENSSKKQIENFEASLRQMSNQLNEQQHLVHTLKTENNSLKIFTNQLKQTVDGQKVAYENLRNQLASVYKEQQKESK